MAQQLNGLFVLSPSAYELVYAHGVADEIARRVRLVGNPENADSVRTNPSILTDVDVIFSGWGCPRIDQALLAAAPRLKAIFYGAGTIAFLQTPAMWERGIVVTSANATNGRPVAEHTVSTVLFSLKHGWRLMREMKQTKTIARTRIPGNYKSVVGLISMGVIARMAVELLRPFGMTILTYDPFLSDAAAADLGVQKVSLETLFAESDVVSLHAPELPATQGLVTGALLNSMKPGATFLNTARGSVVNEAELIETMRVRPDLQAVLDVTQKEPPAADSPLWTLDNVVLTPHIAGSQGRECQRLGQTMLEELDRYLAGQPLLYQVRPQDLEKSAHGAGAVKK
ncbi:MAG: glycerate dehydrogenase [Phycisphaerales bacterium]|nr:glycerate dehydrogenase [Phycisphaerales bacterium]